MELGNTLLLLGSLLHRINLFSPHSSSKFGVTHAQAFLSKIIFSLLDTLSGTDHITINITEIFLQDQSQL